MPEDTGGGALLLLATSACVGCGGAAFGVLQNLKDSVDQVSGIWASRSVKF